jgi:hypothetical protein
MFDRSKISLLPKIISSFKARHSDVIEFLEEIHHNIKPGSEVIITIKHADDIPYTLTTTISQEDIDDINSVTK